jgi:hypothetical protein
MRFDGFTSSDLAVTEAFCHQAQYLQLTAAQALRPAGRTPVTLCREIAQQCRGSSGLTGSAQGFKGSKRRTSIATVERQHGLLE